MRTRLMIDQTDESLARRARAGSVDCFEELVRRYQLPLLRFLQRRGPHRQDTEDVIQDAFLRAYQSLGSYHEDQAFKPWLFTIAYRLSIDAARRQRSTDSVMDDLQSKYDDGPLMQAALTDEKNHLWQLVRRVLADEPFSAVWLHYGESMSSRDIAVVTGRSREWVKTTLLRARHRIKEALELEEQTIESAGRP